MANEKDQVSTIKEAAGYDETHQWKYKESPEEEGVGSQIPFGKGKDPSSWKEFQEAENITHTEDVAGNEIVAGDYVDLIGDYTGTVLDEMEAGKDDFIEKGIIKYFVEDTDPEEKLLRQQLIAEGVLDKEELEGLEFEEQVPWAVVEVLDNEGNPTGDTKKVVHYQLSKKGSNETEEDYLLRLASHINILIEKQAAINTNLYAKFAKNFNITKTASEKKEKEEKGESKMFDKSSKEEDFAGKKEKEVQKESPKSSEKALEAKKAFDIALAGLFEEEEEGYSEDEELRKIDELYSKSKALVDMHESGEYYEEGDELELVKEIFEASSDIMGLHGERIAKSTSEIKFSKIKNIDDLLKVAYDLAGSEGVPENALTTLNQQAPQVKTEKELEGSSLRETSDVSSPQGTRMSITDVEKIWTKEACSSEMGDMSNKDNLGQTELSSEASKSQEESGVKPTVRSY
jgi:hypothetical protein